MKLRTPLAPLKAGVARQMHDVLIGPYALDFYGMERSGHFAIANWLKALMPQLGGLVLAASSARPSFDGHPSGWYAAGKQHPRSGVFIYGADLLLTEAPSRSEHQRVVVTVRDIRNTLASRLRWQERHSRSNMFKTGELFISTWKQYARQVLGDQLYFPHAITTIFYDRWARDASYRNDLVGDMTRAFGWDLDAIRPAAAEAAKAIVSQAGGGSSFDLLTHANDASAMPTTRRWHSYANDIYFRTTLNHDPEVRILNARLTGDPSWLDSSETVPSSKS